MIVPFGKPLLNSAIVRASITSGCVMGSSMAQLDQTILKVNDLEGSIDFYTRIMGFANAGADGPFTVIRTLTDFQMQLSPWGVPGDEHYAISVSKREFDDIFRRIRDAGTAYGPTSTPRAKTRGRSWKRARGEAPTLYFNDPNKHFIEIRTYEADNVS